ncbi:MULTISPECIES: hypothetical protein [unclassified Bradyrhizobium]|uniref:hypothetical protein n=1 Tax=unclassified Bradyrhizobium TaxID=2631580 RepID=UPI00230242AD|nr:hypothetical protein [Bradyrhizobium sp. CCBAU 45321]MDA9548458.1 hypothetical protein [Bradyrhizobium sp. CCBAU 45321]
MIKKLMLGAVIASIMGSTAMAQPSQQQGGAQSGVGGTSDTTKNNDKTKGGMTTGTSSTGTTDGSGSSTPGGQSTKKSSTPK